MLLAPVIVVAELAGNFEKLRRDAELGNVDAQYTLGYAYYFGKGIDQNYHEAVRWLHEAGKKGDARAQFYLGIAHGYGNGVPQDSHEALRWYRKAATQNFPNAQYELGARYHWGITVPQDYHEAIRWYRKAAEQGYADALSILGFMYEWGHGVQQTRANRFSGFTRRQSKETQQRRRCWRGRIWAVTVLRRAYAKHISGFPFLRLLVDLMTLGIG